MKASKSVLEACNLNLKQCFEIKENQYRSKDCRNDYDPQSIEMRIIEIQQRQASREIEKYLRQREKDEKEAA